MEEIAVYSRIGIDVLVVWFTPKDWSRPRQAAGPLKDLIGATEGIKRLTLGKCRNYRDCSCLCWMSQNLLLLQNVYKIVTSMIERGASSGRWVAKEHMQVFQE
jgi:hypothetical protein